MPDYRARKYGAEDLATCARVVMKLEFLAVGISNSPSISNTWEILNFLWPQYLSPLLKN